VSTVRSSQSYAAGVETVRLNLEALFRLLQLLTGLFKTSLVLQTFFFRMQEYPDIQRRAQQELDKVVGRERLPAFEDREHLPYINALCKELLRHGPPVPGGRHIPLVHWNPKAYTFPYVQVYRV